MTTREKLEKVLEFIINEENEKASDLLHDVFVEKARGIYEEIATEDEEIEEATEEEVEEAKSDDDKEDKEQVDEADIQDQFADEVETDSEMIDQEEVILCFFFFHLMHCVAILEKKFSPVVPVHV